MASVKLEICIFPLFIESCPIVQIKWQCYIKLWGFFSFKMKKIVLDQKMDKWQSVNQVILMQHNVVV